jgi:ATP-binding cassette subfamily B protein
MPYASLADQQSGAIAGRLQTVRNDVERFLVAFVNAVFSPTVSIAFLIVYASRIHWALVPTYLVAVPGVILASFLLSRRVRNIQEAIVRESARLTGSATEVLRNVELVKSLGLVTQESDRLDANGTRILELEFEKNRAIRRLSFFHGAGVNLLRLSLIGVMLYLLSRHQITIGQFFSLLLYLYMLLNPIQEFGSVLHLYRETEGSLRSVETVLRAAPREVPATDAVKLGRLDSVAFAGVSFTHAGSAHSALSKVAFEAARGEMVGFVGPSGAGKTTLLKVLLGLYAPDAGSVLFNGTPARSLDFHAFRERIGLVTQDPQLFSGSIRDNLVFVRPRATDAECLEALQQAAAGPLLARAGQGLDTPVGEGGLRLSGGEKQRLAIARALLRRPELLIFDEATSALDSLTEQEVANALRKLRTTSDMITLVIAHRLSTIRHADRIYVLDRGRVVDTGTHSQLAGREGLYRELWRQQTGSPCRWGGATRTNSGLRRRRTGRSAPHECR